MLNRPEFRLFRRRQKDILKDVRKTHHEPNVYLKDIRTQLCLFKINKLKVDFNLSDEHINAIKAFR